MATKTINHKLQVSEPLVVPEGDTYRFGPKGSIEYVGASVYAAVRVENGATLEGYDEDLTPIVTGKATSGVLVRNEASLTNVNVLGQRKRSGYGIRSHGKNVKIENVMGYGFYSGMKVMSNTCRIKTFGWRDFDHHGMTASQYSDFVSIEDAVFIGYENEHKDNQRAGSGMRIYCPLFRGKNIRAEHVGVIYKHTGHGQLFLEDVTMNDIVHKVKVGIVQYGGLCYHKIKDTVFDFTGDNWTGNVWAFGGIHEYEDVSFVGTSGRFRCQKNTVRLSFNDVDFDTTPWIARGEHAECRTIVQLRDCVNVPPQSEIIASNSKGNIVLDLLDEDGNDTNQYRTS